LSKISNMTALAILVCLLAGCSSLTAPACTYNEIVIVNQARSALREVAVSATGSGRMFSCGMIAPRGICANRFPPRPYRAQPVQVDWVTGNGSRHSEIIEPTLPASFVARLPLRGVLVIDAQGRVAAYLQQEAPDPGR